MKATHVIVQGRVQGVFFRDYTHRQALKTGINGWVRNLPDGSVETLLYGPDSSVELMVDWLRQGSPLSRVENLRVREVEPLEQLDGFEVIY